MHAFSDCDTFCGLSTQGRSQDFSKGGGGHIVSNIIVMAFSPWNIVGCLLKNGLQRGGSQAPYDPFATPLRLVLRNIFS